MGDSSVQDLRDHSTALPWGSRLLHACVLSTWLLLGGDVLGLLGCAMYAAIISLD